MLNGIVLVSFINELREKGLSVAEAVRQGAEMRLRPVMMTASVAILGLVPMLLSSGVGAETQRPLGDGRGGWPHHLDTAHAGVAAGDLRVDRDPRRRCRHVVLTASLKGDAAMKEIKAFIHRNRAADVVHALHTSGFCRAGCNLSLTDVAGSLKSLGSKEREFLCGVWREPHQ